MSDQHPTKTQGYLPTVSNTHKTLQSQADSRPSITDAAQSIVEDVPTDDTIVARPLVEYVRGTKVATRKAGVTKHRPNSPDAAFSEVAKLLLDEAELEDSLLTEGRAIVTEVNVPNLCDEDVYLPLRRALTAELEARGWRKYVSNGSHKLNTGTFTAQGSRVELLPSGMPQPYPRAIVFSITRWNEWRQSNDK